MYAILRSYTQRLIAFGLRIINSTLYNALTRCSAVQVQFSKEVQETARLGVSRQQLHQRAQCCHSTLEGRQEHPVHAEL